MKSKVTIISVLALLLGACTTGTYVTDRYDDIYFSPGDVPPPAATAPVPVVSNESDTKSAPLTMERRTANDQRGQTYTNDVFTTDEPSADIHRYDMSNMQLVESDTTALASDSTSVNYIINNYYEGDDIDFGYRINRFHRFGYYSPYSWNYWGYYDPFYYDPFFYDPYCYNYWYSPGWSWSIGWGYGYPYWGYSGYWGGYWGPSYAWGYPGWGGYYPSHSVYYDRGSVNYGRRTNLAGTYGRSVSNKSASLSSGGTRRSVYDGNNSSIRSTNTGRQATGSVGRTTSRTSLSNGATIMDTRRQTTGSAVSTSGRRSISSGKAVSTGRTTQGVNTTNVSRSYQTVPAQTRQYTPSYTKPRTVTRSSYNNNNSSGSSYSKPGSGQATQSRSTYRSTYNSNATYQQGSSRSVRSSSSSSSSPSYRSTSTPSRSYSTGSSSGSSYSAPSRSTNSVGSSTGSSRSSGGSSSSGSSSSRSGGRR